MRYCHNIFWPEIIFICEFCQITKFHTQKSIWKTLKTFLRAASCIFIFTPIHKCCCLNECYLSLYHKITWPGLALPLPEWLISLSIPQDPMVWLVLPLPEWLISLSVPLDLMAWTGTAAAWMVDISLCTTRSNGLAGTAAAWVDTVSAFCVPGDPPALDWHCWCLNSWCSYIMVLNVNFGPVMSHVNVPSVCESMLTARDGSVIYITYCRC